MELLRNSKDKKAKKLTKKRVSRCFVLGGTGVLRGEDGWENMRIKLSQR